MHSENEKCLFKPPKGGKKEVKTPQNEIKLFRRHVKVRRKLGEAHGVAVPFTCSSPVGFERRLTRSTSKLSVQHQVQSEVSQHQGILTRNKSRQYKDQLMLNISKTQKAESGYGTSSDISRDCAESCSIASSGESITLSESMSLSMLADSEKSPVEFQDTSHRTKNNIYPNIIWLKNSSVNVLIPDHYSDKISMSVNSRIVVSRETLRCNMRVHHVSAVVSVEPHHIKLQDSLPGLLIIPLKVTPRDEAWVFCLYSDSDCQHWRWLPRHDFYHRNGCVVITMRQLGHFTVIMEEPYPEVMKKIRCRTGGRLRIPDVPGIEVNFPRGSLEHNIDACLRVLFDDEPLFDSTPHELSNDCLASPIIYLGPHGLSFNEDRLPVLVSLPIPGYQETMSVCPDAKLIAYQSSNHDNEPLVWQKINIDILEPSVVGYRHGISGVPIPIVTFPVYHFSFFKVVWELLSAGVYEARMGMSYFYPYISFSMMCQAFMESNENNRFGLEVICYRSDRKLPDTTNYRHRVGASLKPKLVRPGRINVRLRSQMFEADVEAGEDIEMVKEEPDFRGRDFEKQYACRFKPDSAVERGTFGKVIVERISTKPDPLFEFNLHKTGLENEHMPPAVGCERWTVFAMRELAGSLLITENNNWKQFAKFIGFTKSEIKNKLSYSADPFLALMNMYNSRGGTPEEFIQALYVVSRDIRLNQAGMDSGSPGSGSSKSAGSDSKDSGTHSQNSNNSPMKRLWSLRPWAAPNESDSAESNPKDSQKNDSGAGGSGRKRSRPSTDLSKSGPGPSTKRRRFSDASETIQSSSEEEDVIDDTRTISTEKHKNNPRKLSDRDLWRISSGIVRKDWRNLGRTLGIEETALGNLEHAHQSVGFRECAYQMLLEWKSRKPKKCSFGELYGALNREKMASVAKFMVRKIAKTDEQKEHSDSS